MSRKYKQKLAWRRVQHVKNYLITRMLNLSSSSVKWEGLPDYIDTIRLENILTRTGSAIIGYDDITDKYYIGQNASVGNIDFYGYPMNRKMIGANGQNINFSPDTSVIIYNNSTRSSDLWVFELFAEWLSDILCAVQVNINTQKTMPIIPTTQEQQLSVINAYEDLVSNIPYVLVDQNSFNADSFKNALTFDNRKSFTSDQMIGVYRELWNQFLTYVGINNVNVEKRERTNVPEITSNLDEILMMRRNRINAREFSCKQMSEILGLNVKASYYGDRGGEMHGSLYNGSQIYSRSDISGFDRESGPENAEGGGD